jgi:hypothetical protein
MKLMGITLSFKFSRPHHHDHNNKLEGVNGEIRDRERVMRTL